MTSIDWAPGALETCPFAGGRYHLGWQPAPCDLDPKLRHVKAILKAKDVDVHLSKIRTLAAQALAESRIALQKVR